MKQDRVMSYIPITIVAVCIGISQAAVAYEQPTHKELTQAAATRSELPEGVLRDLGLVDLKSQLNGKSVLEWMRYGADFEDSKIPYSGIKFRFLNHFYNPLNGQGFSDPELPKFASTGLPSPSWGLEDQGDIEGQDYSLKDGYQWLLNGLTLPNKSDREVYLAKTFRTLGHVVHLIQDTGQPQHTRNDDHWYESLYEKVSNEEMENARKNPGNFYGGYPIVQLSKARDYFHTLPSGASNVLQGKGLAEYTNRGFVTTRTNFSGSLGGGSSEFPISTFINDPRFPTPNGNGVIISTLNIHDPSLLGNTKLNLQGDISFVGTNVVDTYDPSKTQPNPRTSSYSVFDADLEKYNLGGAKFTYNRFNAKEAHKFLIPRAVSYSAGLINWFFRGKIDMVTDPADPSQYLIKNLGTEPLQGAFTLYYDDTSDVRKTVTGADWSTASYTSGNQLAAGATITVAAFVPPSDAKTDNNYMLVFKGKIGADIGNPAATDSLTAKTISCGDYVRNGSFEADPFVFGGSLGLAVSSTLTDWTVLSNGTYPWGLPYPNSANAGPTPYGNQWVIVGNWGNIANTWIQQNVGGLTPGRTYTLSFALATEYGSQGEQSRIVVSFESGSSTASQEFAAPARVSNYWDTWGTFSMTFMADNSEVAIRLESVVGPGYDAGIDNVSVRCAPN